MPLAVYIACQRRFILVCSNYVQWRERTLDALLAVYNTRADTITLVVNMGYIQLMPLITIPVIFSSCSGGSNKIY